VLDDWDDAWREAGEFLEAARKRDLPGVRVTVKPVRLPGRERRARKAWGVYVITPDGGGTA
jgi:hypothetical protein